MKANRRNTSAGDLTTKEGSSSDAKRNQSGKGHHPDNPVRIYADGTDEYNYELLSLTDVIIIM